MSRLGGYKLVAVGFIFCLFGVIGMLVGLPVIFVGSIVVVKRSLDL